MPSQQAFCMEKTHNFLQALEVKIGSNSGRAAIDINLPPPSPDRSSGGGGAAPVERGLPNGVTHVKAEWPTSAVEFPHWTSGGSGGGVAGRAAVVSNIGSNSNSGGGLTLWEGHQATKAEQKQQHLRWPSPYAAPSSNSSFSSLNSTRNQFTVVQENNRLFMDATSKSSKVLTDDDHEEDEFGKRKGSSLKVRVDERSYNDHKATTPRSKHSATEQRRRSRINDRLQILRDLIPQSDQKRDKASFLSEVIKYIQFLHEKVQKYESEYPGWNQENTNILPWMKVLFRSFWEHTQKNSQIHAQDVTDPSHFLKDIPAPPGFIISASNTVLPTPAMVEINQTQVESENLRHRLASKASTVSVPLQPYGIGSDFAQNEPCMISDLENMVNDSQSLCLRAGSATGGDMLRKQELSIDEGMISISSAYSQGLVDSFTSALLNSGVDMSQARISAQINLGKTMFKGTQSNPKNQEESRVGSSGGEGSEQANKRQKTGKS